MYRIGKTIYLNKNTQCYVSLLTINDIPEGNLKNIIKRVHIPYVNDDEKYSSCSCINSCKYVFNNINNNNCSEYLTTDDLPFLVNYLTTNNYNIDSKLTKILNKEDRDLLFYITSK
jgi:hypothetical protein